VLDYLPLDWRGAEGPQRLTWRPFSLSMHNQGRDLPADYQAMMDQSWAPTRLITAVRELHGNEVIKPLYDALGEQIHHNKNKADSYRDAIVKALEEVNLRAGGCRLHRPVR